MCHFFAEKINKPPPYFQIYLLKKIIKMLLKRNLLETLTIFSCSGTLLCVLLNYVTNISPITGVWFPIYAFVVFMVSVSLSFKFLQWLLQLNKPMKYDLDSIVKEYEYLSFLNKLLPQTRPRVQQECKEYDTNELSVITSVLERKLVSSWYVPYISQEIGFPFACKQMLDQIVGKTFQICNKIEPKEVYVDICSILISHLKEYRKALKRHDKSPTSTVESLYKKSHPIYNSGNQLESADHCTNIIRVILKDLVPWELRDTPHLELIVRILAKKLDSFINDTLADPAWLNDRLLILLKGEEVAETVLEEKEPEKSSTCDFNENAKDSREDIVNEPLKTPTIESAFSTLITNTTVPVLQKAINEEFQEDSSVPSEVSSIVEEGPATSTEPVDIKSSPVLRQRRGRQGRNEVKIYDRIIEGSVKTWETDMDLQCISLGQDLLASLDGEITLSRLWGQDAETEGSPNPPRSKSPQPLWFGEEDAVDVSEIDSIPPTSPARKEHSPKPAELLKDLQTTVHQAKTRIGDLQDEAAGMMEGLLDFGIAGLKKGLRFTGLGEDSQSLEKSPSHKGPEKGSPPELGKAKLATEPKEIITSTVVQKEENGNSSAPHLIKQQRVFSQDSVPSLPRGAPRTDSPEPEYEEAADLSASIAKLRSLLEQRQENMGSEEIWWAEAEETRGRAAAPSDRPVDAATLADEYNINIDRNVSPGQTSNNMQRLDKLFQRTVTGVFNSLKTAVGAEQEPRVLGAWAYVTSSAELSVCGSVARLVGSRRAYAHVDAALDSLQQLPPPPRPKEIVPEDFEEWCALHGAAWRGGAALAAAAGLCRAHVTHRLAALLFADLAEALISEWLDSLSSWLRKQVFATFEQMSEGAETSFSKKAKLRALDVDETCAVVMERLPKALHLFGSETLQQAAHLSLSSLSHSALNRDLCLRALDAFAAHFRTAAALRSPSFDAN